APEARQAENVRKMLLAMVTDVRVVLVKLADRLHNMRTLQYLEPDKQRRISRETLDIYAPIAHRLGMSVVRGELEDLSFRYLEVEAFFALQKEISDKAAFHKEFLDEVQATIRSKDRKSTRLNSSHDQISYAVFCLKKKIDDSLGDVF